MLPDIFTTIASRPTSPVNFFSPSFLPSIPIAGGGFHT